MFRYILLCLGALIILALSLTGIGCSRPEQQDTDYILPPQTPSRWFLNPLTPFKLRLLTGHKVKFNDPQGLACVRLMDFNTVPDDHKNTPLTFYWINSGDNTLGCCFEGIKPKICSYSDTAVKFNRPWSVAATKWGDVFVTDRGSARVVHLFNTGDKLIFVESLPGEEDAEGLIDPVGAAVDGFGRLLITDAALDRVVVWTPEWDKKPSPPFTYKRQTEWGEFINPDGIAAAAPDSWLDPAMGDYFVVVVDSLHKRLTQLDYQGRIIARLTAAEFGCQSAFLGFVSIDYYSHIIASDRRNHCLHRFNSRLQYMSSFGKSKSGGIKFNEPRGLAVDRRYGQLFVVERERLRSLWSAVEVREFRASVRTDSVWRDLDIDFTLTDPAWGDVLVEDKWGRLLAVLAANRCFPSGTSHLSWGMTLPPRVKGQSSSDLPSFYRPGETLPEGEYRVVGKFRALYSSRDVFCRQAEAKFNVLFIHNG